MCTKHNPDQMAITGGEAARATEPGEPAPEVHGNRGVPAVADELVEIEFHRRDPSYESSASSKPRKTEASGDALPIWKEIDLDTVVPSPAIEAVLRTEEIVRIHRPSTGIAEIEGLRRLARLEPIHVVRDGGRWVCIAHWDLVEEAKTKLRSPKLFLVCVSADISTEEMRAYILTEQIIKTVRHQMSARQLASAAPMVLSIARKHTDLFVQRSRKEWAKTIGKSLSWLKHLMAAKSRKP
jgi:hypothetical protein